MVDVLRRDLLPPTANSELPKNRLTVPGFRQRLFQDATIGVAENNDRSRNSEALAALYYPGNKEGHIPTRSASEGPMKSSESRRGSPLDD